MTTLQIWPLASASLLMAVNLQAGIFADSVVHYAPGADVNPAYTNPSSALGEPARDTPGIYGGPVDPFAPPYLDTQLVSIGAGGSLTVQFPNPVWNHPAQFFGFDFLIFGNAVMMVTNEMDEAWNFIGDPATDGTIFGGNPGETRIWVSQDNGDYFLLNPEQAPTADSGFPTDGAGDFQLPVNPNLVPLDFAGMTLDEIRTLYAGSGGGTGYDISWAQNEAGESVFLEEVNYVRIDVLSGKSDIDAIVIVPEPSTYAILGAGTLLGGWMGWRRRGAHSSKL